MIAISTSSLHTWEQRLALILIVSVPLFISTVSYDSFLLPKFVLLMLLTPIWLWMIVVQTSWRDRRPNSLDWPLLALCMVFTVSICIDYATPIQWKTLLMFGLFVGLFYAFKRLWSRGFSEETAAAALLITALILSVYALLQDYWAQIGVPDFFPTYGGVRDWRAKVIATLGNPNFLGGYLGVSLPVLIAYALRREITLLRFILISAALMLIVACMTVTFCVGVTVGLILAAGAGVILMCLTRSFPTFLWGRAVTLFLLLIASNLWYTLDNPYNTHGASLFLEAKNSPHWASGLGARHFNWRTSLIMIQEQPLTGIGYGNYLTRHIHFQGLNYARYGSAHDRDYVIPVDQPHFQLLETASECGPLGVIAICWVFCAWFKSAYSRLQQRKQPWFAWGALLGVLTAVGHSFSSFPFHLPTTSLSVILLAAWFTAKPVLPRHEKISLHGLRWIPACISALTVMTVAVCFYLSDIYLRRGNETRGVASVHALQQSIRFNPFQHANHFILANRYVELGWHNKALDEYQQALRYQTDLKAHEYSGRIYTLQGNLQQAIKQQRRVIELNPVYPGHYRDLIRLLRQAGQEEAIPPLETKAAQLEAEIQVKYAR